MWTEENVFSGSVSGTGALQWELATYSTYPGPVFKNISQQIFP